MAVRLQKALLQTLLTLVATAIAIGLGLWVIADWQKNAGLMPHPPLPTASNAPTTPRR